MLARLLSPLLLLTLAACPNDKDGGTDSDAGTGTDATNGTGTEDTSTEAPTGGELPAIDEVCQASCENFKTCSDDPAMFNVPDCVLNCAGTIDFLEMNNPGIGCGEHYLGLENCFSTLTCDEIDAYFMDSPMRPCGEWSEKLDACAIE